MAVLQDSWCSAGLSCRQVECNLVREGFERCVGLVLAPLAYCALHARSSNCHVQQELHLSVCVHLRQGLTLSPPCKRHLMSSVGQATMVPARPAPAPASTWSMGVKSVPALHAAYGFSTASTLLVVHLAFTDDGQVLIGYPQRLHLCLSLLLFQALVFVNLHIGHRQSCRPISLVGCMDVVEFSPLLPRARRTLESTGMGPHSPA